MILSYSTWSLPYTGKSNQEQRQFIETSWILSDAAITKSPDKSAHLSEVYFSQNRAKLEVDFMFFGYSRSGLFSLNNIHVTIVFLPHLLMLSPHDLCIPTFCFLLYSTSKTTETYTTFSSGHQFYFRKRDIL